MGKTCRGLRYLALPHLWARLDACFVPADAAGHWYKYVMWNLKRKARGVLRAEQSQRDLIK